MRNSTLIRTILVVLLFTFGITSYAQQSQREKLAMDFGWRFAFGHPYDTKKDFNHGTGYFSYLAKAGYGDGPADAHFDDRAWRVIDIPHDWAAEAAFDGKGSHSHGYKAIGRNFPESSVGWYRKTVSIPEADFGKRISIAFDGVSRNAQVWINGFFLGTEPSGYNSFEYDVTDFLNYGGENVIAVRADVTMEEGWFYEGAGIYRHAWLKKTNPVHVATNGTYITSTVKGNVAQLTINASILNESKSEATIVVEHSVIDAAGKVVGKVVTEKVNVSPLLTVNLTSVLEIQNPLLWSIETPTLYKVVTVVRNESLLDYYETTIGIRTIRFDADKGFFLNGKSVKLKGTNNHQDHAGVGTAIPDALQDFRIAKLKEMGSNAYRCSHNPPTPELLDACDRLGMVVIDENRLMTPSAEFKQKLKDMILRDRNHPSVIAWSVGNEEWAIEGNIKGARIAESMQAYTKTIDKTRPVTAAVSGGREGGISTTIDIMGYNYIGLGTTEEHHKNYPMQPAMGTEEGSTHATRGIYVDDKLKQQIAAYDRKPSGNFVSLETGWTYYAERDALAGMFIWTGFDYRGESTPYSWPSVYSYFGMLDACGFPKDDFYYLQSWWLSKPIVHILPHWNWKGREGEEIDVWVYSNCDEVELLLNKKSLGKKTMKRNSHLEWKVKYAPGAIEAIGFNKGKKIASEVIKTTGEAIALKLSADRSLIKADNQDVSIITVEAFDNNNLMIPTAGVDVEFSIQGEGKIIGVGNGDETSHEPDRYLEKIKTLAITTLKEKVIETNEVDALVKSDYDDSSWSKAFQDESVRTNAKFVVYRCSFELPSDLKNASINFYFSSIGADQTVYVNGTAIGNGIKEERKDFKLDTSLVHSGKNSVVVVTIPLKKKHDWDTPNSNPGLIQIVQPSEVWKRKLFSGKAQIIVQSTMNPGEIVLNANSQGLKSASLRINSRQTVMKPFVK